MEPGRPRQRAEVPAIDLDVSWLVPADLGAVDALARLQVTATRCGRSLQLHGACGGLPVKSSRSSVLNIVPTGPPATGGPCMSGFIVSIQPWP